MEVSAIPLNGQPAEREATAVVDFNLESREGYTGAAPPDAPPASATGVVGDAPGGGVTGDQPRHDTFGITSSCSQTMPKVALPQRVRVSQGVSAALLVNRVHPEYPQEARRGRIQGAVLMHAIVSKDGDIATLELVSRHPMLSPAAIEAVKQWKYKPYLLSGKPVEVDTQIQVNFTLSGNWIPVVG